MKILYNLKSDIITLSLDSKFLNYYNHMLSNSSDCFCNNLLSLFTFFGNANVSNYYQFGNL